MIREIESAPNVFTKSGEKWVSDLCEALRNSNYDKSKELGSHKSWSYASYSDGRVPQTHPDYGQLVRKSAQPQYMLISSHEDSQDVTEIVGENTADQRDNPNYFVENFGKVRIYCEAVARNVDHLFTPITGWDGQNFRWITMPVVSDHKESCREAAPVRRKLEQIDQKWIIHDEEVGVYESKKVLVDYGMCWYGGDWKVSESQLFDGYRESSLYSILSDYIKLMQIQS